MKVLVTGATGQLGYDLMREFERRRVEAVGTSSRDFDLRDEKAVKAFIERERPDAIIHAAAYTAVDKAEEEAEVALAINGDGTRNMALAAENVGAKFLYVSTDYVFPGEGDAPYLPGDEKGPQNLYGRSKLWGELAVEEILTKYFITRISWVFGKNGKNFVTTMLNLADTHEELKVVADQVGSPTYTVDAARLMADMIATDKYGVYHVTNEGFCSWAEFATEIFRQSGKKTRVIPVPSAEYPTKAIRPQNSRMDKSCLKDAGFKLLPNWKDALGRFLIER